MLNNPILNPGLGTFVWTLVIFGILVFILAKWGWPMLLKSLKKREQAIADSLNAAEKAREELAQLQSHNEDLLKEAKQERDAMLANARALKEQIVEEARQKADAEIARMREEAVIDIENEKLRAIHDLKNQVANLSIEIAEKLVRAELSDKQRAQNLIDAELENVTF